MIGDGPGLPDAKRIIEEAGLGAEAHFTGLVEQEEGPEYLAACDILASPHVPNADGSPFFGSPTKLFEYMAMGKAIVASNLDQIGETLRHPFDPDRRGDARLDRRLNHRLAVLIHAHEEMHCVAPEPSVPADAIGADLFQRVPQVGIAVGIINGGGEVELRHSGLAWAGRRGGGAAIGTGALLFPAAPALAGQGGRVGSLGSSQRLGRRVVGGAR